MVYSMVDCCLENKRKDEFSGSCIVNKSKNSCRGATHPSFNVHSLVVALHASPYGLPIVAVPTVGFWLIVVCEPAVGLATAMLATKYQKELPGAVPPSGVAIPRPSNHVQPLTDCSLLPFIQSDCG